MYTITHSHTSFGTKNRSGFHFSIVPDAVLQNWYTYLLSLLSDSKTSAILQTYYKEHPDALYALMKSTTLDKFSQETKASGVCFIVKVIMIGKSLFTPL